MEPKRSDTPRAGYGMTQAELARILAERIGTASDNAAQLRTYVPRGRPMRHSWHWRDWLYRGNR